MHYGRTFFSKDGSDTITTKDQSMQDVIGNADRMSETDIKELNSAYR